MDFSEHAPTLKFVLECSVCSARTNSFAEWYRVGQECPECGSRLVEVRYLRQGDLLAAFRQKHRQCPGVWRYFDFLPLNDRENCLTAGEGDVEVERWEFLEVYARRFGVNLEVYAHRHDNNPATGTFKDLTGAVSASVLKEAGIKTCVVASTGNIGVALSRYYSAAGISLYVFIPENCSRQHDAEIGCFGQRVFRVKGDYEYTKQLASDFAKAQDLHLAPGGFDPVRIEAKKTMMYEWLRQMEQIPTVYIQGLSGGTGPLGIGRACKELEEMDLLKVLPRMYLVQTDRCAPMAIAWHKAKAAGFPTGWKRDYPIIKNPQTIISTLATGTPGLFPLVGELVRNTGGEIVAFPEKYIVDIARFVAYNVAVRIGPAAAVAVGGFFLGLKRGDLQSGDVVALSIGEGVRRSPEFMKDLSYTSKTVTSLEDCATYQRKDIRKYNWDRMDTIVAEIPPNTF